MWGVALMESHSFYHTAPQCPAWASPVLNAHQSPFFHHVPAQTLAGSSAPDNPGKPGALMGRTQPGVFRGGQLRPRPEPQEGVRWTCGQRKSPTSSQ